MRLLLISNELGYRGTPRYLANCAALAAAAGHQVLIWGLDEGGATADACRADGFDVRIGEAGLEYAIEFHPDIVHIHRNGWHCRRESEILRKLKAQTGCRILETSVFGQPDLSRRAPIDLHAHISQWDLWRWRRWIWPLHQPGILLPYCLDTEAFRPAQSDFRTRHHIPADAFLIGRLGKTDWGVLNKALLVAMQRRPDIWFATVGDYSAGTNTQSIFQKFADHIVTIPRLVGADELSQFYSACNVTVNFSPIGESFGYGIAESMACGTPVITLSKPRNDNAQIELDASEYGGFPVDGAETAAKTFIELATDRGHLDQARAKCRASIERRYSLHTLGPQILKTYELLHSSTATGRELERLFQDHGFTTNISQAAIFRQLSHVRGGLPSRLELLKMKLAYTLPNALRIYVKTKS